MKTNAYKAQRKAKTMQPMFSKKALYVSFSLLGTVVMLITGIGIGSCNKKQKTNHARPKAIIIADINGDGIPDAIAVQENDHKLPYTCAGKGAGIVCHPPVQNAKAYEKVLNTNYMKGTVTKKNPKVKYIRVKKKK